MSTTIESLTAPPSPEIRLPSPVSRAFELLVVAACSLVVLVALAPDQLFTGTMPLGTDVVGHAVVAWWDSSNPLGFLPGSWSDDVFNGFPVNQLYPWLPTWIAGLLAHVVPLGTAMKLVVVVPLVLMPFAAWRAGAWARLPEPLPTMLALGTLPFLFDTSCGSCGGTIYSTVNGEYAFAWSMMFGVLALGAVDRLAREGRGATLAPLLVAATAFSHPLPSVWLVIGVGVVAIGREVWADPAIRVRFTISALVALLLSAMWWLPFVAYQSWMPDNPLTRDGSTLTWLFPASTGWEAAASVLGLVGLAWAWRRRAWLLLAWALSAAIAVAAFLRFTDGGPFYSIRVLPFWQFGRWALAAVGFAWVVKMGVARLRRMQVREVDPRIAPIAWFAVALVVVGSTWGFWGVTTPATTTSNGEAEILGQRAVVSFASTGAATSFRGFEARADGAELAAVQDLLRQVGQRYGCGTLMWDSGDVSQDPGPMFGDAQVFWQAPIWTGGCVTSATGLLVDSSATAPALLMTETLVSQFPEALLPGRPTFAPDLAQGAQRMKDLGIRYYLTQGGSPAEQAATTTGLEKLASGGRWTVWGVTGSSRLQGLDAEPAVFEPTLDNASWEAVNNRYFTTSTYSTVRLAQSGPDGWPRAGVSALPTSSPVSPARFTAAQVGSGRISFTVDKVGSPVMVKASDFPGWQVSGADGPYRVSPNYLVVVPTATTVTLVKGRTRVDWIAILAGLSGLALLVGVGVYRRLESRSLDDAAEDPVDHSRDGGDATDDEGAPRDEDPAHGAGVPA